MTPDQRRAADALRRIRGTRIAPPTGRTWPLIFPDGYATVRAWTRCRRPERNRPVRRALWHYSLVRRPNWTGSRPT